MSIQAVAWVLDNSQTRGFDRLVMIALANRVNGQRDDGECWPSMRTIAKDAGMSAATVHAAVKRIAAEYPTELEVSDAGSNNKSARYRLPFACGQPSKGCSATEQGVQPRRTPRSPQGRTESERTGMNLGASHKTTCTECPAYAVHGSDRCALHASSVLELVDGGA